MFPKKSARCAMTLAAVASVCPLTAYGQGAIDEIVVTADYRERTESELPASITVLDAEEIAESAVQHFEELIGGLANVNWSGDGHRARYLQIRGVGELAQYQGAPNPSVGFVIDDIDFSGIGSIATLWDVDRIEILRGPQGTRYGANALAGLVYLQSTPPGDEREGKIQLIVGGDDAVGTGIAIGGPVGSAGYRVSAHHYRSNGFRDNPYLGRDDTNGRDETLVRGRLDWSSGDRWNYRLVGMSIDVDDGYDAFAIDNSLTVLSDNPGRDAQQSLGVSLRADRTGGRLFDFTSITSFAGSDIEFSFDADWGNEDAWAPVIYDYVSLNQRERRTIHQEFRLLSTDDGRLLDGRAAWLAGLYLNRLEEDFDSVNLGEYFDPGFDFESSLDDRLSSRYDATSIAVYGQLEFDAGGDGKVTAGARFERRSVDYGDSSGLDLGPAETMGGGEIAYTQAFGDDLSAFLVLSRGFKGGGFNLGFVPEGRRSYDAESMWNLESGIRAWFRDRSLFLRASVFHAWRVDQQVETSFQIDPNDPASFVFFVDNAADGESYGLEADIRWLAGDGFEVYGSLGLLRAKFDSFVTPQVDASGRDQAHAPRYTFSLGGVYRHRSGWYGRVDVNGKDAFYFDVSHDQKSRAYALANVSIGYGTERWDARLWANNAADRRYAVRGFYFGNEPPLFPPALYVRQGDPRQAGMTINLRF